MEQLPYIDEHAITVAASLEDTWAALLRVICGDTSDPPDPSAVPFGFVLDEARPPTRLALKGRHPFAVYRWVFELDAESSRRTRLRALTWADFPGVHGTLYRALVIGTGGHRMAVRWTLRRVAAAASDETDYVDVFEVPIAPGDLRTAEEAFRDAVGHRPGASGTAVSWIHRHVLRLDLGPYSAPGHLIGWPIVRSDPDEFALATGGPLMDARLTLRREDGRRATLTTRLHYRREATARAVWAAVGPLHRAVAPQLMRRSAARARPVAAR